MPHCLDQQWNEMWWAQCIMTSTRVTALSTDIYCLHYHGFAFLPRFIVERQSTYRYVDGPRVSLLASLFRINPVRIASCWYDACGVSGVTGQCVIARLIRKSRVCRRLVACFERSKFFESCVSRRKQSNSLRIARNMSVVASYVNTETPGVSGVAFSGYSHAKQGMSLESPSPEGVSDAQVDQMNPSYGFIVAGKRGEAQPPPPVPSKAAHYQAPKSNMPVYERMDSVTRFEVPSLQSPCDPSAPLVDSPVEADNDASLRRESRNPVYSQQDGGIDRKRVFSGETEDEVVTYNKSRRKCCSVKAALLSTLLIILFFMSAASLMLNLLMLFGGLDLTGEETGESWEWVYSVVGRNFEKNCEWESLYLF